MLHRLVALTVAASVLAVVWNLNRRVKAD